MWIVPPLTGFRLLWHGLVWPYWSFVAIRERALEHWWWKHDRFVKCVKPLSWCHLYPLSPELWGFPCLGVEIMGSRVYCSTAVCSEINRGIIWNNPQAPEIRTKTQTSSNVEPAGSTFRAASLSRSVGAFLSGSPPRQSAQMCQPDSFPPNAQSGIHHLLSPRRCRPRGMEEHHLTNAGRH